MKVLFIRFSQPPFRKRRRFVCRQVEYSRQLFMRRFSTHSIPVPNDFAKPQANFKERSAAWSDESVWSDHRFSKQFGDSEVWTEDDVDWTARLKASMVWIEVWRLRKWEWFCCRVVRLTRMLTGMPQRVHVSYTVTLRNKWETNRHEDF